MPDLVVRDGMSYVVIWLWDQLSVISLSLARRLFAACSLFSGYLSAITAIPVFPVIARCSITTHVCSVHRRSLVIFLHTLFLN